MDDIKKLKEELATDEEEIREMAPPHKLTCVAPNDTSFAWSRWTFREGHTVNTMNLLKKSMSMSTAREACNKIPGCRGFTFEKSDAEKAGKQTVRWNIAHPRGHPAKSRGGRSGSRGASGKQKGGEDRGASADGHPGASLPPPVAEDHTTLQDEDSAEYNSTVMAGLIKWNTGKAEHECDRLCRIPRDEYRQLDMCKNEVIEWWKNEARLSPKCKIDPQTGMEVCKDDFRCAASATGHLHTVDISRTATYDCTQCDHENEGLRLMCCNACEREICPQAQKGQFSIGGKMIDTVICEGCGAKELAQIAKRRRDFCKDSPGSFECDYNASCSTGTPQEVFSDRNYDCECSPCAACGDHAAKSECCADCLTRTCAKDGGSDKAREVCAGCSMV